MKDRAEEISLTDFEPGLKVFCLIKKSNRVRRINLRIHSKEKAILTLPRWASLREGYLFLDKQKSWLAKRIKRFPATCKISEYFSDGGKVWLAENPHLLSWHENESVTKVSYRIYEDHIHLNIPNDEMREENILFSLRALAKENLTDRVESLAIDSRLKWNKVRIGNQKSRWGSCSAKGTISLNWRLVLLPYEIANYVINHELAHLKHLNHSAKFWEYLETLCPNSRVKDKDLLKVGKSIICLAQDI